MEKIPVTRWWVLTQSRGVVRDLLPQERLEVVEDWGVMQFNVGDVGTQTPTLVPHISQVPLNGPWQVRFQIWPQHVTYVVQIRMKEPGVALVSLRITGTCAGFRQVTITVCCARLLTEIGLHFLL